MNEFTTFDGKRLAYLDSGTGSPVVLLHGFASDHRGNWVAPGVVAALVAAGHRVVALDARGHGHSEKPHDPAAYGEDAMVRDVQSLLDHLDLSAVTVVGYSMGSLVALRLTPRDSRVRAVVLGGVGAHLGDEHRPRNRDAIADALETDDPTTVTDAAARAFRAFADSTHADRLALAAIQRAPLGDGAELSKIAVPAMVLTGDADTLVGRPEGLAAKIPGATATVVSGDHLTAVMDPAFTAAIVAFADRHAR